MNILLLLFLIIFGIFLSIIVYKLLTHPIKAPFDNPKAFLKNSESRSKIKNKKRIVFIGDSITHGLVSINYINILRKKMDPDIEKSFEFINAGINNQLVWHILQRLNEIIACKPDIITILIGTNDCNDSRSPHKQKLAKMTKGIPQLPTKELFIEHYNQLITRLQTETQSKIVLLSIPILSEDPDEFAYNWAREFNQEIKKIAEREHLVYLPVHEKMHQIISKQEKKPKVDFKYQQTAGIKGIINHLVFNVSLDKISKKNGFQLLTDHVHLNSKGADIIASLIFDFLKK